MLRMFGSEPLGHEFLDGGPQELAPRIPEQQLGLSVDEHDVAVSIDDDDRVRRGFEETSKLVFRSLALGDVANGARHENALLGLEWAETDLDRKFGAVRPQAVKLQRRAHSACAWVS